MGKIQILRITEEELFLGENKKEREAWISSLGRTTPALALVTKLGCPPPGHWNKAQCPVETLRR